jgi:hypothetical protein
MAYNPFQMDSLSKGLFESSNQHMGLPTTIWVTKETIDKREKDYLFPNPKTDYQTI